MVLDLATDLPAEDAGPAATEPQTNVIATLVTVDAVVVRVADRPDGSLALMPSGNRAPIVLDRFQRGAFLAALAER